MLVQLFQDRVQLALLQGLEQIVPYAKAQSFLYVLKIRISAHDNKIDIRVIRLSLLDQLQSRHARHAQVGDDGVWMQLSDFVQQLQAVIRLANDLGLRIFDQHFTQVNNTGLVIRNHNGKHPDPPFYKNTPGFSAYFRIYCIMNCSVFH